MSRRAVRLIAALLGPVLAAGVAGLAMADPPTIEVLIKDHRFTPAQIHVPANQPVVLMVTNADPLAEEFNSTDLKVEKVIAGGQKGMVRLRPLRPGHYDFMGEYHSATAQGVVIAQ